MWETGAQVGVAGSPNAAWVSLLWPNPSWGDSTGDNTLLDLQRGTTTRRADLKTRELPGECADCGPPCEGTWSSTRGSAFPESLWLSFSIVARHQNHQYCIETSRLRCACHVTRKIKIYFLYSKTVTCTLPIEPAGKPSHTISGQDESNPTV